MFVLVCVCCCRCGGSYERLQAVLEIQGSAGAGAATAESAPPSFVDLDVLLTLLLARVRAFVAGADSGVGAEPPAAACLLRALHVRDHAQALLSGLGVDGWPCQNGLVRCSPALDWVSERGTLRAVSCVM